MGTSGAFIFASLAEVQPRLSTDGMIGRDLALGPLQEWFLAYELDLDDGDYSGGLEYHNVGIGTNIAAEGFEYFQANLFARRIAEDYGHATEGRWDGYMANVAYGRPFRPVEDGAVVYFSGWADLVFGARHSRQRPTGSPTPCSGSIRSRSGGPRWA